ncbi:MAG: YafY family transcriptional regulator [Oceanospirillaceae bacterium]|nr:YafY family transcriptional regulator [Oceanospirillaceae bacterium]
MRKAERLFQLLTLMRGRRTVITAQTLAEYFDVSDRTIYRDIQALTLSGVPIEGEAGVGYRLKPGFSIPPLMFSPQELEALLLGVRMVQRFADTQLGIAADSALCKIQAILPDKLHFDHAIKPEWMLVPDFSTNENAKFGEQIRAAIKNKNILNLEYETESKQLSNRKVRPLGLIFWGKVWTLVGWCELREDYRSFRLDRIKSLLRNEETYLEQADISLQNFLDQQGC